MNKCKDENYKSKREKMLQERFKRKKEDLLNEEEIRRKKLKKQGKKKTETDGARDKRGAGAEKIEVAISEIADEILGIK
jgi:hypothetical protein